MRRDYITLGPTPAEENCAKISAADYTYQSNKEGRVYINQLKRMFPEQTAKISLTVKAHPHEYGTYYEVAAWYENEEQLAAVLHLDHNVPAHWDEEAKTELGLPV